VDFDETGFECVQPSWIVEKDLVVHFVDAEVAENQYWDWVIDLVAAAFDIHSADTTITEFVHFGDAALSFELIEDD